MFTHAWCAENTFKVSILGLVYFCVFFAGTLVSFDGCGNLAARLLLVFCLDHGAARRLSTFPTLCRLS